MNSLFGVQPFSAFYEALWYTSFFFAISVMVGLPQWRQLMLTWWRSASGCVMLSVGAMLSYKIFMRSCPGRVSLCLLFTPSRRTRVVSLWLSVVSNLCTSVRWLKISYFSCEILFFCVLLYNRDSSERHHGYVCKGSLNIWRYFCGCKFERFGTGYPYNYTYVQYIYYTFTTRTCTCPCSCLLIHVHVLMSHTLYIIRRV